MKKTLALVLALVLCLGATFAMADTFGLGVVTGIGSSKPASEKDGEMYDGTAQVDTTICALIVDDNGVIVDVHFDVAQTKIVFTGEGAITTAFDGEFPSKMVKGEAYGMRKASPIGAEWFEQVQAFEAYCVGKTVEEILAMPTYAANESHLTVPDVADLKTTCTIDVGEFLAALAMAADDACAR